MKSALISAARIALYRSGLLPLLHRLRNRNVLTIVMFHRVLAPQDPRWAGADPEWTLSVDLFRACLDFFRRHYAVIGLDQLMAARDGAGLPPCPLLITFDDGWADNAEYALPALREAEMPATLFVAAAAVDRREAFWQERIYAGWATGRLRLGDLRRQAALHGLDPSIFHDADESAAGLRAAIAALQKAGASARDRLLASLPALVEAPEIPDQMISADQLRQLAAGGVAIGLHGHTHNPLTEVDAAAELSAAQHRLGSMLGGASGSRLETLSFPHGRYDGTVVAAVRSAGIRLMFSSDPVLTPLTPQRRLVGDLVGRVGIGVDSILDSAGTFRPDRLATWLMTREMTVLPGLAA